MSIRTNYTYPCCRPNFFKIRLHVHRPLFRLRHYRVVLIGTLAEGAHLPSTYRRARTWLESTGFFAPCSNPHRLVSRVALRMKGDSPKSQPILPSNFDVRHQGRLPALVLLRRVPFRRRRLAPVPRLAALKLGRSFDKR